MVQALCCLPLAYVRAGVDLCQERPLSQINADRHNKRSLTPNARRRPLMFRLAAIVYVLTAAAFAGAVVTALLTANVFDRMSLAAGAVGAAVAALPAAWLIARQLYTLTRQ